MNLTCRPTKSSLDFRMAGVSNQNDYFIFSTITCDLRLYLRHQRASCIKHCEISIRRLLLNFSRDPVRTENNDRLVRHFKQLIHKYRTSRSELINYTPIVDYFVPNIDRWAIA